MALQLKGDMNQVQYGVQELECVPSPPYHLSLLTSTRVGELSADPPAQHEQSGG
jgi:hypothetical protein